MFNPTNGNQRVADQVDQGTDEFASLFTTLPVREQLALIQRMNEMLSDDQQVQALIDGTFGQQGSGSPAALGAGTTSSQPLDTSAALQVILNDPNGDEGIKAALRRIMVPRDPEHIPVGRDGTPAEITSLKRQITSLTNERDRAQQALDDEQDPNKTGSLAHQLAAVQATPATPADMVRKDAVKSLADEAKILVDSIKPAATGGAKTRKTEALAKVDEVINLVS